jgi:hypothetical protein
LLTIDDRAEQPHGLSWQYLSMSPERMGLPVPQQRMGGRVRLARDGSNVADVLIDLGRASVPALEGLVETMAYVRPYSRDIQPTITNEIERKAWLPLSEAGFKVPGWMLSTGAMRLLPLPRHPAQPAPDSRGNPHCGAVGQHAGGVDQAFTLTGLICWPWSTCRRWNPTRQATRASPGRPATRACAAGRLTSRPASSTPWATCSGGKYRHVGWYKPSACRDNSPKACGIQNAIQTRRDVTFDRDDYR